MAVVAQERLAERFDEQRPHLRAVAYRMLGSLAEADDAVQESWLRLARAGGDGVADLRAWLTTVTGRICLDMLRSRRARREQPLDGPLEDPPFGRMPDPVITPAGGGSGADPEQEALLTESVGLALQVVLETLSPAERLAFVLHDMFAVPFADIAGLLGRSTDATKQLASRARGRVRTRAPRPDAGVDRQHAVVGAFFRAARGGDFEALVALLDPEIELRADGVAGRAGATMVVQGAAAVARQALLFSNPAAAVHPVLVNGAAGVVITVRDRTVAMMAFTVVDGRVAAIEALGDPARLGRLPLPPLSDTGTF